MKPVNEILGNNLVAWREQRGLKMETAAKELGVSTATWGHWETGRRFPAMNQLSILAQYVGVPPCRLISDCTEVCQECPDKSWIKS